MVTSSAAQRGRVWARVRKLNSLLGWCTALLFSVDVGAATLTVTTIFDPVAPGFCTLREAIASVNAAANSGNCVATGAAYGTSDTINFNIVGGGAHGIAISNLGGALPTITKPVFINGYSQPGSAPNSNAIGWNGQITIEIDGSLAGDGVDGLTIVATGVQVRGLAIHSFGGNSIGNGIRLGSGAINGNSNGNTIAGNFIGIRADWTTIAANTGHGIALSALGTVNNNIIGGPLPADRNIVAGNGQSGLLLNGTGTGNTIRNNYIGTDAPGILARPNSFTGVWINQVSSTLVQDNVIAGNNSDGILIQGNVATGNRMIGNSIGVNALAAGLPNSGSGILIAAPNNIVGGTNASDRNIISSNNGRGVSLAAILPNSGNQILGNSIFGNLGLGIDLNQDLVTANDSGDADTGPNGLQNFSVIATALNSGSITGTLNSAANSSYRVEFFSSTSCDPSGFGEGQTYLGSGTFATDGSGNATVNFVAGALTVGNFITATATNQATNDTSEFSACVAVTAAAIPPASIPPTSIPSLSEWGIVLLTGLLAIGGLLGQRRRNRLCK